MQGVSAQPGQLLSGHGAKPGRNERLHLSVLDSDLNNQVLYRQRGLGHAVMGSEHLAVADLEAAVAASPSNENDAVWIAENLEAFQELESKVEPGEEATEEVRRILRWLGALNPLLCPQPLPLRSPEQVSSHLVCHKPSQEPAIITLRRPVAPSSQPAAPIA